LATAWERLSDTELQLTLRDDVTFHNGDPFTADDVVFTFERMLNADAESDLAESRTYFSTVTSVVRDDDYTVTFTTAAPDPLLIKRLASWASWIVPKAYIEEVGDEEFMRVGMGTGPYKFASFEPDNELVMERYDGYWGDLPPAKQITFRVIPEVAARVTALINDEVQIITNIPPDQVAALEGKSNVGVREIPLANVHVLVYNTNNPLLADKKLRQALNLGIDRQLIIDTIWNGKAVPKRGHQFAEYGPLYNPDRPLTPYDPERAKALLAESSYDGAEIEYQLQAGYYTNGEQVAEAIVGMWQEIGVNAVVRINEKSTTGEERQVHTWSNSSRLADPDGSIWVLWGTDSSVQKNYWTAPAEFNRLGEEARATLDEEQRYENYQQLLDIWEDEAPGTVLYDPHEFYGVSNAVNWSPYSFYYMDLRAYNLSFNE
jgi:peptide/nickel transport system substrate-binding protein